MVENPAGNLSVRDAGVDDLPALTAIKGEASEMLHRDRLRDARHPGFRYLVLLEEDVLIGLACLVFQRPAYWSDGDDPRNLPQIVDLEVLPAWRGRGRGTFFIHAMERLAAQAGCSQLYISVEPLSNPRAYALYKSLGYRQLQEEPYLSHWFFLDSDGQIHQGEDWAVDMCIDLKG